MSVSEEVIETLRARAAELRNRASRETDEKKALFLAGEADAYDELADDAERANRK